MGRAGKPVTRLSGALFSLGSFLAKRGKCCTVIPVVGQRLPRTRSVVSLCDLRMLILCHKANNSGDSIAYRA